MKSHDVNVFIWNMSEDIFPFLSAVNTKTLRDYETVENDLYADREFFSFPNLDVSIYITPQDVSSTFRQWVGTIVGKQQVQVLIPKTNTSAICTDILHDNQLIQSLLSRLQTSSRLVLRSYSATPQFLELADFIRKKGVTVVTPEAPVPEGSWVSNYFGSKAGIRQVISQFIVPKKIAHLANGYVLSSIQEAASVAAWMYIQKNGVVVKTNKAHSGSGVLIYRNGSLPSSYRACVERIITILSQDDYWKKFPIIVEECITLNEKVLGGNPSIEVRVNANGMPSYLYTCGMRVDTAGAFGGVEIGNILLDSTLNSKLKQCGMILGTLYGQAGYRGYFDVDCLYSTDNKLYIAESNIRRTGGTYVYELATFLFGKRGYKNKYFASTTYTFSNKAENFTNVMKRLESVLYSSEKKEGIIATSENLLKVGRLMYIVVADAKERAEHLEKQMQQLLSD